ncbi:MAG: PEP-utilizing enzyme [Bacteroidetes bacterium]|nr:PEP-utilizing enzyme [Bacteroidota bacterium]
MILRLHEIDGHPVGGKAKGLNILKELGFNVPDAVVLLHPDPAELQDSVILQHLNSLGPGPKAIRSSAVSEDGHSASFAGQFESYLNLYSFEEIKLAIHKCIKAAGAERVRSYSGSLLSEADLRISVIMQNMVDARVAGVVFSVNPVNNRHDKMLVNAIAGHGEDLVSGKKDACHYEVFRSGSNIAEEAEKNGNLLNKSLLKQIIAGARSAESFFKAPVDMEWAIDQFGVLNWLQVRPVTALSGVHFNELDTVKGESSDIWTLGNIGEMMPGVATPLTYSVSAEAIDYGMVLLAERGGAYRMRDRKGPRYIQMFYNRLFINMSNMMDYPKRIWLNTPEDVQFALSGKIFNGLTAVPDVSFPVRFLNFIRQMSTTLRAGRYLEHLRSLEAGFRINISLPPAELHHKLEEGRIQLGIGFGHHLMASAQSGTMYSAFMRIMTGNKRKPGAADHHIATMLLLDIPEIESADAVKTLERFARTIRSHKEFCERFTLATSAEALELLEKKAPQEVSDQFRLFLERHGHRCVRESELREKTWAEKPSRLIQILQTRVKAGEVRHVSHDTKKEITFALSKLRPVTRIILRSMIPAARKAVARREITKALSIKMVDTIRKGYQSLALHLTKAGLLDDTDQVYFLTHEELGKLIADRHPSWKEKADKRRELISAADKLVFEEVSVGIPEPLETEQVFELSEGQLAGIPVSSGIVEAPVRIIHSLEDAEDLLEGEIMVASFTDIGWTPYFSIISGLITEIGSPLSHGAVVAREYGIPAVVAAKGAKKLFKTGDRVRLDGEKGLIEKI